MSVERRILDRLQEFTDALESGEPLEQRFKVTTLKKCSICGGDGCHPMANHPRTDEVRKNQPCPMCKGKCYVKVEETPP